VNGIDVHLAAQINSAQRTLDIAAFEFDNKVLTPAVLDAHARGVTVRIVTDDEHGLEEEDESIPKFIEAGIPVVDDSRGALMHNKFMIIDSQVVWTGSWNYTRNDTYRNNNNALALRSRKAVEVYQAEFNEMFLDEQFGPTSPTGSATFTVDGVEMTVLFASEDPVVENILAQVNAAQSSIRFLSFSFTYDEVGQAMLQRVGEGVTVEGVFEKRGSETEYSELPSLYCAGLNVRQDGNPYALHHKVIIIDDHTVLTGSFNFSSNATNSNDENMIIIKDRDIASLYIEEFNRMMAQSKAPDRAKMNCS
jgi:phosphatidylserine/phosphatidylglycerophosphate/cardiolipin synthase-like enzyme